jgi:hypothetical protein
MGFVRSIVAYLFLGYFTQKHRESFVVVHHMLSDARHLPVEH